jgi:accessory gene regulator protein AgrB
MEIEMDKFLAKKNPIFNNSFGFMQVNNDLAMRYRMNSCIIQLALKSIYELTRQNTFGLHTYQQLQCDVFFLF